MSRSGDQLLTCLAAMANPHRMRILARLQEGGPDYVSRLARELGISRPLLHLHLKKLEEAGLITSWREISDDGKALNFYRVQDFQIELSPRTLAEAAGTLQAGEDKKE